MLAPDTDPSTLSPEAQAYIGEVMANPLHMAQGMIQKFIVTAAGTQAGPSERKFRSISSTSLASSSRREP